MIIKYYVFFYFLFGQLEIKPEMRVITIIIFMFLKVFLTGALKKISFYYVNYLIVESIEPDVCLILKLNYYEKLV